MPQEERPQIVTCENLIESIDQFLKDGFRLDMIIPADSPRSALISKDSVQIRLESMAKPKQAGMLADRPKQWIAGRAGMEYRDLTPDRLGGQVIASHIRLMKGGDVPDYVHYHKVKFQMIYCLKGAIRVVYEDQGEPFWMRPGDCVLQPPEIRHRVLYSDAGSEVVELGMPAAHETWVEHEITLPTAEVNRDRIFNRQRFVRHIAADADWKQSEFEGFEQRDTGISSATGNFAEVSVLRAVSEAILPADSAKKAEFAFCYMLSGDVKSLSVDGSERDFLSGDAFLLNSFSDSTLLCSPAAEILLAAV